MGVFKRYPAIVLGLICLLAGSVPAGVQVLDDSGDAIPGDAWSYRTGQSPGSWIIELDELWNPWGNTWFRVVVDPGEDIEQLLIHVDGPPAGSPVTVTIGEAGSPVRKVQAIRQTGTAEVILHQLNVIESLGSVEIQSINFIDVGGHVEGPLIVTNTSSELRGIRRLDVAGDILGDIIVSDGTIRELIVLGDIGTPEEMVRIEVGHGLWEVDVRGDINASMDLCVSGNNGFLHRLVADDFNGTLRIDRLDRPAGSESPPLLALGGWLSGTWSIAGSLHDEEALIQLPPGGLRGQVIVNANGEANGTWDTPIAMQAGNGLPPISLSGPVYDEMPSTIGGGAVGLVPYRVHGNACIPPSGSVLSSTQFDSRASLRFYGPVAFGWGDPLTFERKIAGSDDDFEPIDAAEFCPEIDEQDPCVVHVTTSGSWGGFEAGWRYRISPTPSLLCAAPVNSPVSQDHSYLLELEAAECEADVDDSGAVDIVDLLLVLALWGQGGTPASDAADVDANGVVDVDDLLIIVAKWGSCE